MRPTIGSQLASIIVFRQPTYLEEAYVKRTIWGSIVLALVLTAGLVGLGLVVFNAGVAQGLAQSGNLAAPAAGSAGVGPWAGYGHPGPWGFLWGPLACLIPLLILLFFFSMLRRPFFYRHHWGPGWGDPGWGRRRGYPGWEKGYPPFFEAWHRRAHGEPEADESEQPTTD
jgi:hypothetical protein